MIDWGDEETDLAQGEEANAHLWEESWDDDERNEDFAQILKWVWSGSLCRQVWLADEFLRAGRRCRKWRIASDDGRG